MTSSSEARAHLERQKVDLVVTDLKMPEMSGDQLINYLRTKDGPNQRTPVILFSGFISERDIAELNDVYLLEKPFNDELIKTIAKIALFGAATKT